MDHLLLLNASYLCVGIGLLLARAESVKLLYTSLKQLIFWVTLGQNISVHLSSHQCCDIVHSIIGFKHRIVGSLHNCCQEERFYSQIKIEDSKGLR